MKAIVKIRAEPNYRRAAFEGGLRRLGYDVTVTGWPEEPSDLLLLWNRKGPDEAQATEWERRGGTVIVCENGYIGRDDLGRQLYAIAAHGHNGSGWFPINADDRFGPLAIELSPWRTVGAHVLICGQRGIGSKTMASPPNWHVNAAKMLSARTKRTLRIRLHPGNQAPQKPLEDDLEGAWACVVWSSSSGVRALTLGIPVLVDAPHWICREAVRGLSFVENPLCSDAGRAQALHAMAHAQWRVSEIEQGEPFARMRAAKWGRG